MTARIWNCVMRDASAAQALRRSVTFAEDPTFDINDSNSEDAAILQLQAQRNAEPLVWIRARTEFDRPFNTVKTGNGKAGSWGHSLKSADTIRYLAEGDPIRHQFTNTGTFFDKLHHGPMIPPKSE